MPSSRRPEWSFLFRWLRDRRFGGGAKLWPRETGLTALWLAVAGGVTGALADLRAAALLGVAMAGVDGLGGGAGEGAGATASAALGGCAPGGLTARQPEISTVKASPIIDATRMACPRPGVDPILLY